MEIFTSYFGNLRQVSQTDLVPVGIAVYPPSWYRGLNFKKLAPKPDMLKLSGEAYRQRFQEILDSLDPQDVLNELKELSGGKDIVLLCFEKDRRGCHRKLVADWLNENLNRSIREWEKLPGAGGAKK